MKKRDKYLITGGAGFIGSHLADFLVDRGHYVSIIDNLSTGRWANVEAIESKKGVEIYIDTILNEGLLDSLIRECDAVFHLASAVGVKLVMERPVSTVETIVKGTDVVLAMCSRYRKPVLITSSSEVYGKSEKVPFSEEDDCVVGATEKRRWAYACAKALDEFLALAHYYETDLPVRIVRLFNTVGPRQTGRYGMVLPTLIRQALRNEELTIHGDGSQTRCFCDVSDIVSAIYEVMETPECIGQVINLGSTDEISIRDLAFTVIEVLGSKSELQFVPYREVYGNGFDDMQRRVPDLSRAKSLIDFKPRVKLKNTILRTAHYLNENRST